MESPSFSNRKYIYKCWIFHCYVSLLEFSNQRKSIWLLLASNYPLRIHVTIYNIYLLKLPNKIQPFIDR